MPNQQIIISGTRDFDDISQGVPRVQKYCISVCSSARRHLRPSFLDSTVNGTHSSTYRYTRATPGTVIVSLRGLLGLITPRVAGPENNFW